MAYKQGNSYNGVVVHVGWWLSSHNHNYRWIIWHLITLNIKGYNSTNNSILEKSLVEWTLQKGMAKTYDNDGCSLYMIFSIVNHVWTVSLIYM